MEQVRIRLAEEKCIVPGCDNELSEDERSGRIAICSSCEAAEMHLCGVCPKKLSIRRIKDGATICEECERTPGEIEGPDTDPIKMEYGEEEELEPDDFMV